MGSYSIAAPLGVGLIVARTAHAEQASILGWQTLFGMARSVLLSASAVRLRQPKT
jgi:hypothetical protein